MYCGVCLTVRDEQTLFAEVLIDRTLRQIARKAASKRFDLGMELGLSWTDINTLQCQHSDDVDLAFHVLMVSSCL